MEEPMLGTLVRVFPASWDWLYSGDPFIAEVVGKEEDGVRLAFQTDVEKRVRAKYGQEPYLWRPQDGNIVAVEAERFSSEYADFLFRHSWHSVSYPKTPFARTNRCAVKERHATEEARPPAVRRVAYNFWGTVVLFDACQACVDAYHGKCGEDAPGFFEIP